MKLPMCALVPNGFPYNTTIHAMQQENNIHDLKPVIGAHCSDFTNVLVC